MSLSNLTKMHDRLGESYKKSAYKILKNQGINNRLEWANTFRCHGGADDGQHGYEFKLKDGRQGRILLGGQQKIVWL